jgi:uncharacterized membrane protein
MSASDFFTKEEKAEILAARQAAEKDTSGEIRIHVEKHCKGDLLDRAAFIFAKLDMHKTELRNGVLFYLAIDDHKFAILGDKGINAVVPANFWQCISDHITELFKQQQFTKGLSDGIRMAGKQLAEKFPYQENDKNELSDEISFRKF